ncbi:MAG: DUF4268 domain-containing protein [Caldilineaceae bacterium]|nr:DUF4268 domain-containing protein [Caldilineaceae bacterium]
MQDLGKLEKVPVRDVWEHEARDFTPWLAENLSELGEALGLDLDDAQYEEEASVGSYSVDIWAQGMEGDRPVIIENQLEKTNHDHLGKLLTYAAGYNAGVVVWIAGEFTDEHRAAIDWLNQETGVDVDFFGVIVEAWKIGSSRVAPHFTVVANPNSWSNRDKSGMSTNSTSEREDRYRKFFQKLVDTMREEHEFTKRRKAKAKSWVTFPSSTSGVVWATAFGHRGVARVELYLDSKTDRNKLIFDKLSLSKTEIHSEFEKDLNWERMNSKKACRISITREGSIDDDDDTLEDLRIWMKKHLLKFKQVFQNRLIDIVQQELL